MNAINKTVQFLTLAVNGLFIGAMTVIGLVLVPFWKASDPQLFLDWFSLNSDNIGNLMIPLGPGVLFLSIIALIINKKSRMLWTLTALLTLINILYFPFYFLPTNNSFTNQTVALNEITEELNIWLSYHWQRTFFAIGALIISFMAVLKSD